MLDLVSKATEATGLEEFGLVSTFIDELSVAATFANKFTASLGLGAETPVQGRCALWQVLGYLTLPLFQPNDDREKMISATVLVAVAIAGIVATSTLTELWFGVVESDLPLGSLLVLTDSIDNDPNPPYLERELGLTTTPIPN